MSPSDSNGNGNGDRYFFRILILFGAIMLGFSLVTVFVAILGDPSDQVIGRMVSAMGSMFTGMLGLTIGYLTGRR